MANLKLSIKIDREVYNKRDFRNKLEWQTRVRATLATLLDALKIPVTKIFNPDWDSMKVMFADEKYIEQVFRNSDKLNDKGFQARLPMALKAQRTVVIHSFDTALTDTHNPEQIANLIKSQGWKITQVFILQSKRAFKIQFSTISEARKFQSQKEVAIGHIKIYQRSMEEEINPCISQCWKCGEINPGHVKENCNKTQICLKCCSKNHTLFECQLPRDTEKMTERQRSYLYCVPCRRAGDHCSLDHKLCPTKRRVLQERIQEARQKKVIEDNNEQRDQRIAEKTAKAIATASGFPPLPTLCHADQINMATAITLAFMEDAVIKGSFQECLDRTCNSNNLQPIKFTPKHEVSVAVFKAICSPKYSDKKPQSSGSFLVPPPPKSTTSQTQRWVNDINKSKRRNNNQKETDGESSMDESGAESGAASNYSKKAKHTVKTIKVSSKQLSPSNVTLTKLKTVIDDSIIHFQDDIVSEKTTGAKNFTITELHNIINSDDCQNSPKWKDSINKETTELLKNNHGDMCVLANYIAYPKQDFQ